jgi:hypothetical protein
MRNWKSLCVVLALSLQCVVARSSAAVPAPSGPTNPSVPPQQCWVSCSRMPVDPARPATWTRSTVGCAGEQVCTVQAPIPDCPDASHAHYVIPGVCQKGNYPGTLPVFEPPTIPNSNTMSCGQFEVMWRKRLMDAGLRPKSSGVTSVRKKECPYDEDRRRVPGLEPTWKGIRGWDPPGCVRTEIKTNDHKANPNPDDNVCCLRQCPEDQWLMLLPGKPPATPLR